MTAEKQTSPPKVDEHWLAEQCVPVAEWIGRRLMDPENVDLAKEEG